MRKMVKWGTDDKIIARSRVDRGNQIAPIRKAGHGAGDARPGKPGPGDAQLRGHAKRKAVRLEDYAGKAGSAMPSATSDAIGVMVMAVSSFNEPAGTVRI
ncbi:MAG: hypothetical protein IPL47_18055 [Phyllobacteriaceae bacterium]|nr:hypothetical protein [Phyllobacteriaceae bacterium]